MSATDYDALRKLDLAVRPLEERHRDAAKRRRSQFRAKMTSTASLLALELGHLKAKRIVLQMQLAEDDQRMDGWPRAGVTVGATVVLSFDSQHGPMEVKASAFDTWQDNLRAIALTMEHQRAVERFGVLTGSEKYASWKAIPQTTGPTLGEELVAKYGSVSKALKETHPDQGGDPDEFLAVMEYKGVIDQQLLSA